MSKRVKWFLAGGVLLLLVMFSGLPGWMWLVALLIWIVIPMLVMKQEEAEERARQAEERARRLR